MDDERYRAAEAVRSACLRVAQDGYERAGLGGLCEEGRWEMVLDAIQSLDVNAIVRELANSHGTAAGASDAAGPSTGLAHDVAGSTASAQGVVHASDATEPFSARRGK